MFTRVVAMAEDKFIIRPKRTYGENTVVSCRMPVEMVKRLDSIGGKTGRTRNELILKCVEFALDKLEIAEEEQLRVWFLKAIPAFSLQELCTFVYIFINKIYRNI